MNLLEQALFSDRRKDRRLIRELGEKMADFKPTPAVGLNFRNDKLAAMARERYTLSALHGIEDHLVKKGTLGLAVHPKEVSLNGQSFNIATVSATDAPTPGDMSQKIWVRDQTLAAEALMEMWHANPQRYEKKKDEARALLLGSLHIMSTKPQLERFKKIIESDDEALKNKQDAWPQIALQDTQLSSEKPTHWRHIQDAFQILAVTTFDALDSGLLTVNDLKDNHKEFLASVAPFLASVDFTRRENSGSWEEILAVRTSVMAIETAALNRIRQYATRPGYEFLKEGFDKTKDHVPEFKEKSFEGALDTMIDKGLRTIASRLPNEAPDYKKGSLKYRTADAALVYVLKYGIPQLFKEKEIPFEFAGRQLSTRQIEDMILAQIGSLSDPTTHGIRRYGRVGIDIVDKYQGANFHTNVIRRKIQKMKERCGDNYEKKMAGYQKKVPDGDPAIWTLFTPQLAAWAAKRFKEAIANHEEGAEHYRDISTLYLNRTFAQVTGDEYQVMVQGHSYHVVKTPEDRLPEAYVAHRYRKKRKTITASTNTPLNWTVAETMRAVAHLGAIVE